MTTPCIITVAITGSLPRKKDNPAVPITRGRAGRIDAGGVRGRRDPGAPARAQRRRARPPPTPERFAQVLDGIRRHCPGMITQVSTGGRSGAGRERGGMLSLKPDMASLATGSRQLPDPRLRQRARPGRLARRGDARHGIKPEVEAFDLSMIFQAVELQQDGKIDGAAARAVRDGREERDAGRPRGVRVLRQDAASAWRPKPRGPAPASAATSSRWRAGRWSSAAIAAPDSRTTCGSTRTRWRRRMRRWCARSPSCAPNTAAAPATAAEARALLGLAPASERAVR